MKQLLTIGLMTVIALSSIACNSHSNAQQLKSTTQDAAQSEDFKPAAEGRTKAGKAIYYCEAITADGSRCKRHVHEAGLLCWQHSAMVKAGKKVVTVK